MSRVSIVLRTIGFLSFKSLIAFLMVSSSSMFPLHFKFPEECLHQPCTSGKWCWEHEAGGTFAGNMQNFKCSRVEHWQAVGQVRLQNRLVNPRETLTEKLV